jgi:hypothetical protein
MRILNAFILITVGCIGLSAETSKAQQYFNGYVCTDDCSGHEAGYNWAEENGIADPSECGGNSQSFIEGCEAFASENDDLGSDEENPGAEVEDYEDYSENVGE